MGSLREMIRKKIEKNKGKPEVVKVLRELLGEI
jgi:hypothetical protein